MDEDINAKMKKTDTLLDVCNESDLYADVSHQNAGISISRYHLRPKQKY
jgi:hypothetical protein